MIPKEIESIHSNLPISRLRKIAEAIDNNVAQHVPGSTNMFAETASCDFDFEGVRYHVSEWVEEVNSIRVISGEPELIKTFIAEFETELSIVVEARNFIKAEEINQKIEELKKLLK